jgi:hypothetical protein
MKKIKCTILYSVNFCDSILLQLRFRFRYGKSYVSKGSSSGSGSGSAKLIKTVNPSII